MQERKGGDENAAAVALEGELRRRRRGARIAAFGKSDISSGPNDKVY